MRSRHGGSQVPLSYRLIPLVALLLVVAACGGTSATTTTAAATTTTAAGGVTTTAGPTTTAAPEPVTVNVWFGRENWIPADNFAALTAEYPHITVMTDVIPLEQASTDYLRAFNAGNPPDIVSIESTERGPLAEAGALQDISEQIARWQEEDPEVYDTLQELAWVDGQYEGVPYGVVLSAQTAWYAYRADLFEAAGLAPPETFEDVLTAARALRTDDVNGHCIVLSRLRGTRAEFAQHFMAMGGEFDNGVPILDSEAGIYLTNFLQTLIREDLITEESYAWGSGDMRGAFIAGNCAMAEGSPNVLKSWSEQQPWQEFWDVVPTPHRADAPDTFRQAIATWGWYVSATAEHPYEASLVLRYLADPEFLTPVHIDYIPTPSNAVWDSAALAEAHPWLNDELRANFENASAIPANPRGLEMNEIIMNFWEEASANIDEPAESITARYQELLDEFR